MEWLEKLAEKHWCFFCVLIDVVALFTLMAAFRQVGISWQVAAVAFGILAGVGIYFWIFAGQIMTFGLVAVVGTAGLAFTLVENLLQGWGKVAAYATLFAFLRVLQHVAYKNLEGEDV